MKFAQTEIDGAWLIQQPRHEDNRGYFSRAFCENAFKQQGLQWDIIQTSESWNNASGTLRGMHFQTAPFEEVKLVRCLKGALFDVILDLRPSSSSYLKHVAITLSAFDGQQLYVPKGVAHGFMTLEPETVIGYTMLAGEYSPEHATGVRWNDPAFAISWPSAPDVISERDNSYPDYIRESAK